MNAPTIITEEIGHSPLGASGADRWMNCPGSIQLAKKLGITDSKSSVAAEEGTAAHEILARCIAEGSTDEPMDYMGTKVKVGDNEYEVDQEMVNCLAMCIDEVMQSVREAKEKSGSEPILFIEESMKHSDHDLMYGTTDVGIVSQMSGGKVWIWIKDLKYGRGVFVDANKPQIKYYAVLIVDRLMQEDLITSWEDVAGITLTIMQPRIPNAEGLMRSIEMTSEELREWYEDELVPAMKETENPKAIIQLGDWCTFCPVKAHCPALAEAMTDFAIPTDPKKLSGELLGKKLMNLYAIASLIPQYEKIAFERALRGTKVQGFKLVNKKANRKFRDTIKVDGVEVPIVEFARAKFGDDAFTKPELLGPPGIEKLPDGKVFVAQCAFTPITGLTLAQSSDKRKEAKPLMDRMDDEEVAAIDAEL